MDIDIAYLLATSPSRAKRKMVRTTEAQTAHLLVSQERRGLLVLRFVHGQKLIPLE
jgi:hypothetical protein